MAALGSQSIASSYEQLLHVDRDEGGDTTTHVSVKDGDNGTTFGFTIASDALMMSSTNRLEFGDTGTYIHQSADGVLDLVSDTEIELNGTIDINGAVTMDGGNVTINDDSGDYDFRVESNGDANMLFVDGGEDRVGVATNSPGGLLSVYAGNQTSHANAASGILIGNGTGANSVGQVGFGPNGGTNPAAYYGYLQTSGTGSTNGALVLGTRSGTGDDLPTERMRIESGGDIDIQTGDIFFSTAGKGICLGVTSNTDSNTLDDYEEGTWNPTFTCGSGTVTVDTNNNTCWYQKVGNMVHVGGRVGVSAISSPSGSIHITNLPFNVTDGTESSELSSGSVIIFTPASDTTGNLALECSATGFLVREGSGLAAGVVNIAGKFDTGTLIAIQVTYPVSI